MLWYYDELIQYRNCNRVCPWAHHNTTVLEVMVYLTTKVTVGIIPGREHSVGGGLVCSLIT